MSRESRIARVVLPPVITFVLLVVVTEGWLRWRKVDAWLFPPPSAVLRVMRHSAPDLAAAAINTAKATLIGFAASAVIGVLLAIIMSSSPLLERAFYPYTVFFQTVPIIAIAPLLVSWFDVGTQAVAAAAFIASVFPVMANTLAGLTSVDPALRDLFRLYGAGWFATLFKLKLPAALPNIFTGLRIAAGLSVIGAIVGEFVAGSVQGGEGLGITVISANKNFQADMVFAAVLMASLLGMALFGAVQTAGYVVLKRWR